MSKQRVMTQQENEKIWNQLNKLDHDVQRILSYLENDGTTNTKGLVETVRITRMEVDDIKKREQIFKAKTTAYGVMGGGVISIVLFLLRELFAKKLGL